MTKKNELKVEDVYKDFRASALAHNKLYNEMRKDLEFERGKQWEDEQKEKLRKAGVQALTINKLRPMIKLVTGIERQSRSDYKVFPEGEEDTIVAEISTILLKHALKEGQGIKKLSQVFKEGVITGACYLEPYIDYTHDILNGDLKIRKVSATRIFPDPDFEEDDLSDARYLVKYSPELDKGKVLELFPDEEDYFENIGSYNVNMIDMLDGSQAVTDVISKEKYKKNDDRQDEEVKESTFDLIEYYYKKTVKRFYVANKRTGEIQEFENKKDADDFIEGQAGAVDVESQSFSGEDFIVLERFVPEIRLAQVIGDRILTDEVATTFPRWKDYPIIPFYAEFMSADTGERDLLVQGMIRQLRDLQLEYNKRRTSAMRHLNQSANSGWLTPKNSWVDREMVAKFGSVPGINLEYDPEKGKPDRIEPARLSQGHEQLAAENAQDMKEASGVNPDLLANDSQSQSGRAILLKQRQGMVMVQEILDNYNDTKLMLGRFLLSQLGELFTVEKAMKVVGEAFIKKNFEKPNIDPETGEVITDENNELVLEVDQEEVMLTFNKILNDAQLGKYEVSIGEGVFSETVRMSNYLSIVELAEKGLPIPPEVLIEESLLPEASKGKIVNAIQQMRSQGGQPNG